MSVEDNGHVVKTLEYNNTIAQMIAKEMQSEMNQNEKDEKGLVSKKDVANNDTGRKEEECKGNHQNDTEYNNEKNVISDDNNGHGQTKNETHKKRCDKEAVLSESCEVVSAENQQIDCGCNDENSSDFIEIEQSEDKSINASKEQSGDAELLESKTGNNEVNESGKSETFITYPQVTGIQYDWVCEECSLPFSEYLKQIDQYNHMMSLTYNEDGTINSYPGHTYPLNNPFANPVNLQIMEYYNSFPVIPNFVFPQACGGNQYYPSNSEFESNRQMPHHFPEQPGNYTPVSECNNFVGADFEETDRGKTPVENDDIDSKNDQDNRTHENVEEMNTGDNQEQEDDGSGEEKSLCTDDESGSDDEVHLPDKRSTCTSESQSSITDGDDNDVRNPIEQCFSETSLHDEQIDSENSEQLSEDSVDQVFSGQTEEMPNSEIMSDTDAGSPKKDTLDKESERKLAAIIDMLSNIEPIPYDPNAEDDIVIDLNSLIENGTKMENNKMSFQNSNQCYYPNFPQPMPLRYGYFPPGFATGTVNIASNNANGAMSFQQGFGTFPQSNPQMFCPGGYQQYRPFQMPPPSLHFQSSNPPPNTSAHYPSAMDQPLPQGQTANSPFQYPAVYFSSAGLLTVLLKYDVAIEMTLDHIIRVVSHQNKVVAATNTRGTCSCIHHPLVKIVQDTTTIDADLYQEWKAQMATEEMTFCNKNKIFKFSYDGIQECDMDFKDLSRDNSVSFLFGQKKVQPDVIPMCIEKINNAQFYSIKNCGFTMWLNGVKIMQNERGDVTVISGPKYLKISPTNTTVKLRTHFVQMSVEANGSCNIIRGVHWLHARQDIEFYLTNSKIEAGFDRNKKIWAAIMPHRLPLRIEYKNKSRRNNSTKKRDVVENR